MSPERWQQIERLYYDALGLAPEQRLALLEQACAGDEELRLEVESLIEHASDGSLLDRSPGDVAAAMFTDNSSPTLIGRQLGHYRVLAALGAGGMGEVYLARDERLGRKVALKLLPPEFMEDAERVARFVQEARAASALNHPNIITIYEIGQQGATHFIATEYIDGRTLRQLLTVSQPNPRGAIEVAMQIANALVAAHDAGIVHRDIKPENVMLRRDAFVKVLDFGLAKLVEPLRYGATLIGESWASTNQRVNTDPGRVVGTPRYMSPEQIRGQQVDGRSDIFSLGVVLYETAVGRAPFAGNTPFEVAAAVLNEEAVPLQRCARGVPDELQRIVSKAMAKERTGRYQTAGELLNDLKNLRQELEFRARLMESGSPKTEPTLFNQPTATLSFDALPQSPVSHLSLRAPLEPVGGAVPLDSKFYIVRATDEEFQSAIARQDSIVLVKGARQVGKTSLLARGLQQARQAGAKVVLTDFQKLAAAYLESVEKLLLTLAESFADQLDLDDSPDRLWKPHLSPGINFERYLRRIVFAKISSPIVWGLDEVDRLFTCDFGSEVFGLFRSWHNERALDPAGPWRRFTLAIAYATEAHLFITDLNQSPFNVGTRLALNDFSFDQVSELNRRYGSPLRDGAEAERYFDLVGGHPYLVRRGLHEMAAHGMKLADLESQADRDEGPFGDHLRRLLLSLSQDAALSGVVCGVLEGKPCPSPESFYRLQSAGLMAGASAREARPRCQLYATYLKKHLL